MLFTFTLEVSMAIVLIVVASTAVAIATDNLFFGVAVAFGLAAILWELREIKKCLPRP